MRSFISVQHTCFNQVKSREKGGETQKGRYLARILGYRVHNDESNLRSWRTCQNLIRCRTDMSVDVSKNFVNLFLLAVTCHKSNPVFDTPSNYWLVKVVKDNWPTPGTWSHHPKCQWHPRLSSAPMFGHLDRIWQQSPLTVPRSTQSLHHLWLQSCQESIQCCLTKC